jgi:hypothetical protein
MPATCRPCRYYVTNTGRVIGGSEVGVLEIPEETVIQKGRLLPGKMFLIDFAQGKMVSDEEYKAELIAKRSVLSLSLSLSRARARALSLSPLCPVPAAVSVGAGSRSRCMVALIRVAWRFWVWWAAVYSLLKRAVCVRLKRAVCVRGLKTEEGRVCARLQYTEEGVVYNAGARLSDCCVVGFFVSYLGVESVADGGELCV